MSEADWRLLEAFVRVAEHGSLTAAAHEMGISQPTAGRYIQGLEAQLGLTLFVRHSRGLTPTERALELLGSAREVDERVRELLRRAGGQGEAPSGTVRVSANEPLGAQVLMPAFRELRQAHPAIQVELLIDNSVSNLSQREADLAVRMFRPTQLDLIAKRLGEIPLGMYAHRDYLACHGEPRELGELDGHTLIGMDRDANFARIIAELGMTHRHFAFRCDNILAHWHAAMAAVGIATLHRPMARRRSELVPVLEELELDPLELWLVTHEGLRGNAAVRLVFEALERALLDYLNGA